MLLRFTSADMLNSSLVDVSSGQRAYNIVTGLLPKKLEAKGEGDPQEQLASSLSSHASISQECRHTTITDASGTTLISISWTGRQPDITILGENVGGLCGLFGSSTVRFMYVGVFYSFISICLLRLGRKSWRFQQDLTLNKYG